MNEEKKSEPTVEVEESKYRLLTTYSDEDVTRLRQESSNVEFVLADNSGQAYLDGATTELIAELKKFVTENDGLGMAAIQLGVAKNVFVMRRPWSSDNIMVVINPKVRRSAGKSKKTEGCFSIPTDGQNIAAMVQRPSQIWVDYIDENGKEHNDELLTGMDARVFLHERDHLLGRLMLDKPHFMSWVRE